MPLVSVVSSLVLSACSGIENVPFKNQNNSSVPSVFSASPPSAKYLGLYSPVSSTAPVLSSTILLLIFASKLGRNAAPVIDTSVAPSLPVVKNTALSKYVSFFSLSAVRVISPAGIK